MLYGMSITLLKEENYLGYANGTPAHQQKIKVPKPTPKNSPGFSGSSKQSDKYHWITFTSLIGYMLRLFCVEFLIRPFSRKNPFSLSVI